MTECEARRHINEARRHLPPVSFCTTTSHSLYICSSEHHTAIVLHKSGNDPHPQRKACFTVHLAHSKYKLQTDKLRLSRRWSSVVCFFLSVLHFFLPSCSFSQGLIVLGCNWLLSCLRNYFCSALFWPAICFVNRIDDGGENPRLTPYVQSAILTSRLQA